MLLLAIAIGCFAVLYYQVMTNGLPITIAKPEPSIVVTFNYTKAFIYHQGGNPVETYSVIVNNDTIKTGGDYHIGDCITVPVQNHDSLIMTDDTNKAVILYVGDVRLPVYVAPPQPITNETLFVTSLGTTYNGWTKIGVTPYINSLDYPTNYISSIPESTKIGWFSFSNVTIQGTSFVVNLSCYCKRSDTAGRLYVYVDYSGGTGVQYGPIAQHSTWSYDTFNLGTHTVAEINNLRVYLLAVCSSGYPVIVDYIKVDINKV